jgi:hypothetical protein
MPNEEKRKTLIQEYIDSLSEKEHQAYLLAKDHLGSLFSVERTSGYLSWVKKQKP